MAEPGMTGAELQVVNGVVHVPVRVKPRASRTRVLGFRNGVLEVALAAPPVDGAANLELIAALASALGVPKKRVTLLSGQTSRNKRVGVEGLSAEDCLGLLGAR